MSEAPVNSYVASIIRIFSMLSRRLVEPSFTTKLHDTNNMAPTTSPMHYGYLPERFAYKATVSLGYSRRVQFLVVFHW